MPAEVFPLAQSFENDDPGSMAFLTTVGGARFIAVRIFLGPNLSERRRHGCCDANRPGSHRQALF